MKRLLLSTLMLTSLWVVLGSAPASVQAKGDDFGAVVKVVEQFYGVKHKGIPFLAKAGIKTATVAARIAGGFKKRLAEAGSVKVAFFEGQELNARAAFQASERTLKKRSLEDGCLLSRYSH